MEFKHEANRVFYQDENGKLLAEITFPETKPGVLNINHTFVDGSLQGQGIASRLVEEACKEIKSQNKKAIATCSYAVKWFENHQEYCT